ncbi:conserved hypothetical protein [Thiomonas arsenitoxydans]|uniref:Transposase n=1 Tax=Thiomonas arsenitoxydans (strain DSM 22701 / CIP 110005 / 3As) TaxID=426114 RepID=A0ABM9T3R4_THIA3|nr:conserved hypothetical protein [Thiomonas arsenitoxydans]CQR35918.1 conserved hypothetical protein [Thiomonas arsenitoxydans]CQR39063.1 conserved hypothetical protein [Thiomonas arsenitoxydans]CQR39167.1 conserved hypothetical protein [Thiomonas arsenitoxydans]CQR43452.1 conserved hypothetical protein [Thiomonas sp. CB3]
MAVAVRREVVRQLQERGLRPMQPNEVWSMDFVFDELTNG